MTPFTLERYRIVELYAELLHCSNMSLLNRPAKYSEMYDSEGRLQGGLGGLEELANVIALNGSYRNGGDGVGGDGMGIDERDEIEPALDFPIHGAGGDDMLSIDDEGMTDSEPGSSDDDVMEEIVMYDEPPSDVRLSPLPVHDDGDFSSSSSSESSMGRVGNIASFSSTADVRDPGLSTGQLTRKGSGSNLLRSSPDLSPSTPPPGLTSYPSGSSAHSFRRNPQGSRRSSRSRRRATLEHSADSLMVVGEHMKRKLIDEGVVGMIVVSDYFLCIFFFSFLTDFLFLSGPFLPIPME